MARPRFRRFLRHGFLPQLIAFEACLRLGSVTRAADELCLAQPTVSGLLRRLSETVGEPVLRLREGRMTPTAAGRELATLCEDVFDALGRYEERRSRVHYIVNAPVCETSHALAARGPMLARLITQQGTQ